MGFHIKLNRIQSSSFSNVHSLIVGTIALNYGAQNEAYKCLLVEKVVNDLCFSWLGDVDRSNGVKRSVYIGLHLVYFWDSHAAQGLLRAYHRFTWGLRVGVRAPGWLVGI